MRNTFLIFTLFCVRDPKHFLHFFYFCQKAKSTCNLFFLLAQKSAESEKLTFLSFFVFSSRKFGTISRNFLAKLSFLRKITDPLIAFPNYSLKGGKRLSSYLHFDFFFFSFRHEGKLWKENAQKKTVREKNRSILFNNLLSNEMRFSVKEKKFSDGRRQDDRITVVLDQHERKSQLCSLKKFFKWIVNVFCGKTSSLNCDQTADEEKSRGCICSSTTSTFVLAAYDY